MGQGKLAHRPESLEFPTENESKSAFGYLGVLSRRWRLWLQSNVATDDQVYRKLLLDLWLDYRAACHHGDQLVTEGKDRFTEFNSCTADPITSTRDYLERIRPLMAKLRRDGYPASDEELGNLLFIFLVDGVLPGQREADYDSFPPPVLESAEPILFYKVNEQYGFMSNFAPFPIDLDGRRWLTSEHYFQAQKFAGLPQEKKVWAAPTPREAAHLGRTLPGIRPDWEAVKDEVMLKALRAKFTQHVDLRQQLLETGDRKLIEHTTNDAYWADGGDGSGRNRLGELLMQVRAELRA